MKIRCYGYLELNHVGYNGGVLDCQQWIDTLNRTYDEVASAIIFSGKETINFEKNCWHRMYTCMCECAKENQ
jgi:hypothetical protein